jgi:hypothetical protein
MFSSFSHPKANIANKMDPPAATDASNTLTDAPVLIDEKLTYENVTEDDESSFRFSFTNNDNDNDNEDLQESATVFQETQTQMQASALTDSISSMPALVEQPVRFHIPTAPPGTTPDSPGSLPSVPSIDLSVKASDMDLSCTDLPDLVSPPGTPVPLRENKRPRIHVETVTDDEDAGNYNDGFEPQVVVNMFEPAAAALPTETTPTPTPTPPVSPVANGSILKTWYDKIEIDRKYVVFCLLAVVAVAGTMRIPVTPASTSHGSTATSVLAPAVVAPSTSTGLTLVFEPAVLDMTELLSEAAMAAPEEDTIDLDTPVFNSTSTVLLQEEKARTTTALSLVLGFLHTPKPVEQETEAVVPEAPPAALLVTEEIIQETVHEEIIQETVVLKPPTAKQGPSLWNNVGILAALFLGMSCIVRKQENTSRPAGQVKGMLKNHPELARFLEGTSLMKKAGRKCRSPAKSGSSSKGYDDVNSNYGGFTVEDLKMILNGFDGRKSGNKADLILALVQCYRGVLSGFKNNQLQQLLAIKGLHQSGKKQEMVDRLVEAGF